ncbi:MAG: MFS transporter [Candidatus Heimdallarchaeota archaeon]|nr:MFS transporter [Candidatus Heimdallarchaeota archaeon]
MSAVFLGKIKNRLPPKNLLPLLFAYMFDSLAISSYWIFFGIWLNEELITPEAGFDYPYLMLTLVLAVPGLVSIIGSSIFSAFSDKTGRRKEIMFFARLLLMAQCILLIFFNTVPWQILLILGVFGVHNVFYILHNTLSTTICHPDKRGEVSSFQIFFSSLGWMIGSSVSGLIYDNLGMIGGLSFGAGFALITGIVTMFSPTKPSVEEDDEADDSDESFQNPTEISSEKLELSNKNQRNKSAGYWKILTRRNVLFLLVVLAILDFGFGPFNTLSSVYLKEIGLSSNFIGYSNTIATFLGMTFQLFIGRILDKKGRRPVLLVAIVAYPVLFLFMYLFSNNWVIIFIIYSYPLYALKNPTANAIMSDVTKSKERARGMSLLQFENTIFIYLGAFLGAFIADISPDGLLTLPLFPLSFGIIASVLAIFIIKETNKKLLGKNLPQYKTI